MDIYLVSLLPPSVQKSPIGGKSIENFWKGIKVKTRATEAMVSGVQKLIINYWSHYSGKPILCTIYPFNLTVFYCISPDCIVIVYLQKKQSLGKKTKQNAKTSKLTKPFQGYKNFLKILHFCCCLVVSFNWSILGRLILLTHPNMMLLIPVVTSSYIYYVYTEGVTT